MNAATPQHFTDANFAKDVLGSDQPVLVDFWAPWCGPCRLLTPVIEQLAEQFGETVTVGKLNVDENPETARALGITSIPSVYVFQNGEVVEQLVGVHAKQRYEQVLAELHETAA